MSFLAHEAAHLDPPGARCRARAVAHARCSRASRSGAPATSRQSRSRRSSGQDLLGSGDPRRRCRARRSSSARPCGAIAAVVDHGPAGSPARAHGRLRRRASLGAFVATRPSCSGRSRCSSSGTFLIGFGNSSNNLSRYAAADLVAPKRRAVGDRARRLGLDGRRHRRAVARADRGRDFAASVGLPTLRRAVPRPGGLRRVAAPCCVRPPPPGPVRARPRVDVAGTTRRARPGPGPRDPDPADRACGDRRAHRRAGDDGR